MSSRPDTAIPDWWPNTWLLDVGYEGFFATRRWPWQRRRQALGALANVLTPYRVRRAIAAGHEHLFGLLEPTLPWLVLPLLQLGENLAHIGAEADRLSTRLLSETEFEPARFEAHIWGQLRRLRWQVKREPLVGGPVVHDFRAVKDLRRLEVEAKLVARSDVDLLAAEVVAVAAFRVRDLMRPGVVVLIEPSDDFAAMTTKPEGRARIRAALPEIRRAFAEAAQLALGEELRRNEYAAGPWGVIRIERHPASRGAFQCRLVPEATEEKTAVRLSSIIASAVNQLPWGQANGLVLIECGYATRLDLLEECLMRLEQEQPVRYGRARFIAVAGWATVDAEPRRFVFIHPVLDGPLTRTDERLIAGVIGLYLRDPAHNIARAIAVNLGQFELKGVEQSLRISIDSESIEAAVVSNSRKSELAESPPTAALPVLPPLLASTDPEEDPERVELFVPRRLIHRIDVAGGWK